jgi:hypothetical protein
MLQQVISSTCLKFTKVKIECLSKELEACSTAKSKFRTEKHN